MIGKTIRGTHTDNQCLVITFTDGSTIEIRPEINPEHPQAGEVAESDLQLLLKENILEPVQKARHMVAKYEQEYREAKTLREKLDVADYLHTWLNELNELTKL